MGYNRKSLQILGGGFNLLPPPDKTPTSDYLLAQNWRVDSLGRLVSRYGYQQKFSIAGAGLAHSAAVHGGINGDYYVGCNSAITSPTGSLYWNSNPSAIATGFDGNRIGLAAMNGWMWFMNRSKQGRHTAALGAGTSQAWSIAAPSSSCSAAVGSTPTPTSSATFTYTLQGDPAYNHYLSIAGVTYSFAENGYSAAQLPLVIASMASQDPNCSVTFSGSGSSVTVTPKVMNTLIPVSGSDGNAAANVANGAVSSLPNGTYTFYVTFESADGTLESNGSPSSLPVTVTSQAIALTGIPTSADSRVGKRNVYAIGGTLASAYLVGSIADNVTTTFTVTIPDLDATNGGITLPVNNDPPPAAAGMAGPHFGRLFAWSTAENTNRLFYTEPNLPQYWPGSNDTAVGNWVDVGMEGEAIVWCTIHGNLLVIYKERSVWMLIGDPSTGTLQRVRDGFGLAGQFAVVEAGASDYLVSAAGLYRFDMDQFHPMSGAILPLFTTSITNPSSGGALKPPGSILLGSAYNSNSLFPYAVAIGYAMGKLYIGYAEQAVAASYCLLVYNEADGRWFYHRNGITYGFFGFIFDGAQVVGLTGSSSGAALGMNLDDFRTFAATDPGSTSIECVYQSHYEACGLPDNQKNWLEVAIDVELAGDTATVYAEFDSGKVALTQLGSITGSGRKTVSFALGTNGSTGAPEVRNPATSTQGDGFLAKSMSAAVYASATHPVIIHNVYLYYYEEARLAMEAAAIPTDLGVQKIKQCKELQLDIDASGGNVAMNLYSDMPGNTLAVRQTPTVTANSGRAVLRFPFSVTEGYLWRLALAAVTGPFRLYSARLLMRVIGTYVEAYEAAAGFVWDSMEQTFDSGVTHIPRGYAIALAALPIKRARELSLEIETFNNDVTVKLLTDLPGNTQVSRFTTTVNTGTSGRSFVRIPLPAGLSDAIEGRIFRLQISGTKAFRLYSAALEILAVGVYVEAYEAAAGAVYDSRELDFGTPAVKEARELELDIEITGGNMTAQVVSDLAWRSNTETPSALAVQVTNNAITTTGRQKVLVPLTVNAALDQFIEGRLLRLILSGTKAFRLYGARLRTRQIGTFIDASEGTGGAVWDSTDLDLGSQTVKQLRELELDICAYGAYVVTVYTDLPGNVMLSRVVKNMTATAGRTKVQIPLPQGTVPDNYVFGRMARVTISSAAAFKLFGARIHARPIGVYVEAYEAASGAVWDSMAQDLGSPGAAKYFDELQFEMDSDGPTTVAVYTDLPGESMVLRGAYSLTTAATSRHWAVVQLPSAIAPFLTEGRAIRLVVSSASGFRIYRAQVSASRIGQYLAAMPQSGTQDYYNTLDFDFQSGKVKMHKKVELDAAADGPLTITVNTEQNGQLAAVWSTTVTTPNGRMTLSIPLPPGIRGRLLRIALTSPAAARVFRLRTWSREVNQPDAQWAWDDYPLETSDVVPSWKELPIPPTPPDFSWADLPVEPTKPEWAWAPLPVNPTEAQWFWAKFLSVEETSDTWNWVDVDFQVTG